MALAAWLRRTGLKTGTERRTGRLEQNDGQDDWNKTVDGREDWNRTTDRKTGTERRTLGTTGTERRTGRLEQNDGQEDWNRTMSATAERRPDGARPSDGRRRPDYNAHTEAEEEAYAAAGRRHSPDSSVSRHFARLPS